MGPKSWVYDRSKINPEILSASGAGCRLPHQEEVMLIVNMLVFGTILALFVSMLSDPRQTER
jgi:hypothetical protein